MSPSFPSHDPYPSRLHPDATAPGAPRLATISLPIVTLPYLSPPASPSELSAASAPAMLHLRPDRGQQHLPQPRSLPASLPELAYPSPPHQPPAHFTTPTTALLTLPAAHPHLRIHSSIAYAAPPASPPCHWDVVHTPSLERIVTRIGARIDLARPATHPPLRSLHIMSAALPPGMRVAAHGSGPGGALTVRDLLAALAHALGAPLPAGSWAGASRTAQRRMLAAAGARGDLVRVVDWLDSDTRFAGFSASHDSMDAHFARSVFTRAP